MSEDQKVHSEDVQITAQIPEGTAFPEPVSSDADGITIINDTSTTALVLAHNGFLGPASNGFVGPSQQLVLPVGWAWWDVYALFEYYPSQLLMKWNSAVSFTVYYNKKKTMVGYRDTIRLGSL